jgi:hypothetical protein
MFDELNDIIKTDSGSQEKFKHFKINFRKTQEDQSRGALRRARIQAIVLGSATVISLLFLIVAQSQHTLAQRATEQVEYLQSKLDECQDLHNE